MANVTITIAGVELTATKNKEGDYGVSVLQYQSYLGLSADFTRDSKRGKSPEVLQEAGIHTGLKLWNSRQGRSTTSFIDTRDLVKLVGVFAFRGNKAAQAWLMALAAETLERRIDAALNVDTTEDTYEERTKAFYRELARASYIPELMTWNERHANYGAFTNAFKVALRLPLTSVNEYCTSDMQRWSKGITAYNALRYEGAGHKYALAAVRRQQADV